MSRTLVAWAYRSRRPLFDPSHEMTSHDYDERAKHGLLRLDRAERERHRDIF